MLLVRDVRVCALSNDPTHTSIARTQTCIFYNATTIQTIYSHRIMPMLVCLSNIVFINNKCSCDHIVFINDKCSCDCLRIIVFHVTSVSRLVRLIHIEKWRCYNSNIVVLNQLNCATISVSNWTEVMLCVSYYVVILCHIMLCHIMFCF